MRLPSGAYAPVPTPLDRGLEFDPTALSRHLKWLAGQGLDGALVLGTNGEFPSLSLDERLLVAEGAADVDSGLDLMLGVGSCALPEVLVLVSLAENLGYSSVLCPPPFYFRSAPVEGLATFFLKVLDASAVPVLLYHIPQVSGVAISDELLDAVGRHENLRGVKDSSGDVDELARLSSRFESGSYIVGSDRLVRACMASGGKGSISAAASVSPTLVAAVQKNDAEQRSLNEVRTFLEDWGLGPSVKALLRRGGFGEYATRPPLQGLDDRGASDCWAAFSDLVSNPPLFSSE